MPVLEGNIREKNQLERGGSDKKATLGLTAKGKDNVASLCEIICLTSHDQASAAEDDNVKPSGENLRLKAVVAKIRLTEINPIQSKF